MSSRTALVFQGGIGVVGLLAILILDIPVQNDGLAGTASVFWGCLGALATYLFLILLTRVPGLFPDDLERQMRALRAFALGLGAPTLLALCILAGVGEELLFRAALQGWLAGELGLYPAVGLASVLFGLAHYVSFSYFLVATGLGLLLGSVYVVSGSLSLVMVWHAVYDMIALFCLLRFPHWFGLAPKHPN
ncbi:CPBP family intramembrane metalloprotease [Marinobacter salinisoli]|uniref:CPBP family intramembrane metalloprotease n=2 Tax=Marinobacter salinisoli TaxID=2769486 RepID=A0ABX7MWJ5_9GAMM|nr:CPBP family intramembrane metalloprotease [Marinobacter salinisoli]